jgi:hypothetical protein
MHDYHICPACKLDLDDYAKLETKKKANQQSRKKRLFEEVYYDFLGLTRPRRKRLLYLITAFSSIVLSLAFSFILFSVLIDRTKIPSNIAFWAYQETLFAKNPAMFSVVYVALTVFIFLALWLVLDSFFGKTRDEETLWKQFDPCPDELDETVDPIIQSKTNQPVIPSQTDNPMRHCRDCE